MRFGYRLALAQRRLDVRQMLSEMDSRELSEWMAYYQLEPWGTYPADRRSALVAWIVACANSGKHRPKFEDFMPRYWRPELKQQPWQQMKEILCSAFGIKP